ncbi:MAG: 4-hydroxy-3-methylbut-2-enyl diphosphate reductase [Candidatus Goldiibacteriota bacterium]|jgi:4-hydroxy-3-methylbut-2-enyl diphosphate reductase
MKVYVAEGSGFCFGVKRAMDMAFKYARSNRGRKVYSLREIIHNPQEVKRLEAAGARHVEEISGIARGAAAIISTHGVTKSEEEELKEKCAAVLDTTCPYVKKIHNIVKKLAEEKYQVIIAGDADHPEVKSILGYAGRDAVVVAKAPDVAAVKFKEKVGVVSQTTQNIDVYLELIGALQKKAFVNRYTEVRSFNTICDSTKNRQAATLELAKKADILIIVGGRNSANTKRLYELGKTVLPDVYHVESALEIRKEWFRGKKAAGVSAGASTPEKAIAAAVKRIKMIGEK